MSDLKKLEEIEARHQLRDPGLPAVEGPADRPRDWKAWARADLALLAGLVRRVAEASCERRTCASHDCHADLCGKPDPTRWCWPCRIRGQLRDKRAAARRPETTVDKQIREAEEKHPSEMAKARAWLRRQERKAAKR